MSSIQGTCEETLLGCTQAVGGDGLGWLSVQRSQRSLQILPLPHLRNTGRDLAPQTKLPPGILIEGRIRQETGGKVGEPLACNTHLCLWGAPFISNQQQIALSVNNNLFLEAATCHTHRISRYAGRTGRAAGRETWASLVGKYTPGCHPGGHSEPLGLGFGSASSNHGVLKGPDSGLSIRLSGPVIVAG